MLTSIQLRRWIALPGIGDLHRQVQFHGGKKDCLIEIQRIAALLGKTPTVTEFNKHGNACVKTVQNLFGSWNAALKEANLGINNQQGITNATCLAELRRVAKKLGKTPTTKTFRLHSTICAGSVENKFGTWTTALVAAGLTPTKHVSVSRREIIAELRRLSRTLGHTCSSAEFTRQGRFGVGSAVRKFGSWNRALKSARLPRGDE
jgi:hypothetical protein